MNILPFKKIQYLSSLPPEDIWERLGQVVEPRNRIRFGELNPGTDRPYQGRLDGPTFLISRIIQYRNSFLPSIHGKLEETEGGTCIMLSMKPNEFGLLFMALFLGVTGLASLVFGFSQLTNPTFDPMILIPSALFVGGYFMMTIAFGIESTKSKAFFSELFEAKSEEI